MLYEEENPPPPKKCNPFPFIFQIIALIIKAPSSIQDAYFFIMVFGGGTLLGFIIGGMINGEI